MASTPAAHRFAILSLAQVEFRSAVRRREREGDIDEPSATLLLERLDHDLGTRFLRQHVTDRVIDVACTVIDRHRLRAYDAIQLAGCLILKDAAPETPIFHLR